MMDTGWFIYVVRLVSRPFSGYFDEFGEGWNFEGGPGSPELEEWEK